MGKRFAVAGFQNSGKSYPRRWIPDGDNVMILQPSNKFPHLYTGPANANLLTPEQLDAAEKAGTRKLVPDFDILGEDRKTGMAEAFEKLKGKAVKIQNRDHLISQPYDLLLYLHDKPAGYFPRDRMPGNVMFTPSFDDLKLGLEIVNKHMPWIHTIILPDFTHFITSVITSDRFLAQNSAGQAFQRYLNLAADAFKSFILSSDNLRKELVVVTEYHVEFNENEKQYELFVPGGKMVKEKFLPSSYYDIFLFTDVEYTSLDDNAEPIYRYVTRKTRKYPEARSMGLFQDLFVPNNLQLALTEFRRHYNIPVQYDKAVKEIAASKAA
jgi:hypothetical protein